MVEHDRLVDKLPWNLIGQIGMQLLVKWPEPIDVDCATVAFDGRQGEFVRVMILMQDSGWIMYEALLIGTSDTPQFLSVSLTAKGRSMVQALLKSKSLS